MPLPPQHTQWLVKTKSTIQTADGKTIEVWEFNHCKNNQSLSAWAKHFREHYCLDSHVDALRKGTSLSRSEYLNKVVFPDSATAPGPSIRAGDFGEILVADFLEYLAGFWVPRTRYDGKTIRNESTKGTDIIGFKFAKSGEFSRKDVLALYEAKARFSASGTPPRLQDAINDSAKDQVRVGESLNAIKRRFIEKEQSNEAAKVERFQNIADNPYTEEYGAVALFDIKHFDEQTESTTTTLEHPKSSHLKLLIIKGVNMMTLVHELYRRAADEA